MILTGIGDTQAETIPVSNFQDSIVSATIAGIGFALGGVIFTWLTKVIKKGRA